MPNRHIVIYKEETEVPADYKEGEILPMVRGDGPREGDMMGMARVESTPDGALELNVLPGEHAQVEVIEDEAMIPDEFINDIPEDECVSYEEGGCAGPVEMRPAMENVSVAYCDRHWQQARVKR